MSHTDSQPPCHIWSTKYKIPDLNKTSSGVGLKYTYPPRTITQVKPLGLSHEVTDVKPDVRVRETGYATAMNSDYIWHYPDCDPSDRANGTPGSKYFIKRLEEKLKLKPPNPPGIAHSEYKAQFPRYDIFPFHGHLVDRTPYAICKVKGVNREEQRPTRTEEGGVLMQLDPYLSTAQTSYAPIERGKAEFLNAKVVVPESMLAPREKPVFDKNLLKHKFIERTIRRKVRSVPNSGMQSETKDSFGRPLDDFAHRSLGVIFPAAVVQQLKSDVFATPAMYHTEYSHIGVNWRICAVV